MPAENLKVAIVASALTDDVREAPQLARSYGFAGMQFDAATASFDITALSGSGRREFRRLLAAQNRELVGLRFDAGGTGFGPRGDVDQLLSRLDLVLEAAAGLSAPLVCLEAGPLPRPPVAPKSSAKIPREIAGLIIIPSGPSVPEREPAAPLPPPDPAFVDQVNGALVELGRRADRFGVVVAFRSELSSFAALEAALLRASCPWFVVDLDPAAVVRDEWELDQVFSRLGSQIRHVRGRDALGGDDRRAKPAPIGAGSTDWPALLSNLDAAGYRGWITIDPVDLPDRRDAAIRAVQALRSE